MDSKKRNYLEVFISVIKTNKHIIVPLMFFFSYIFLYRSFSFLFFKTTFHDFYFFDHSVWSFVHGKGLFLHAFNMSFFADHFYPWLLLFVPFYAIATSPFWMFIMQGLLAALMVYPILSFASEKIGKDKIFIISILLFFYLPFRSYGNDFHGELWQAAALSWMIYSIEKKKDLLLLILIFLFPFLKENAVSYLSFVAVYLTAIKRRWKFGVFAFFGGIISSVYLLGWLIPLFARQSSSIYMSSVNYSSNYSYLGEGLMGKVNTMIFHPNVLLEKFFSINNIGYFLALFAPLGFLSLFSPLVLIGVGVFMQNTLSTNLNFVDITAHYAIVFTPIVFIAGIFAYEKIVNHKSNWVKVSKFFMIFFVIINLLFMIFFEVRNFIPPKNIKAHYQILKLIPMNASVAADSNLQGHLQYRERLFRVGAEPSNTEFVVVKKYPYVSEKDLPYLFKKQPIKVLTSLLLGDVRREKDIISNDLLIKKYLDDLNYTSTNISNLWLFQKLH
ncbi:MAG: DUF2079 domain-containing protein [Candidatus Margulisbacteria bacterium]|nr:DUF2079 domain-containing protein [Candidatus Margulisiibacteriota bacterium]